MESDEFLLKGLTGGNNKINIMVGGGGGGKNRNNNREGSSAVKIGLKNRGNSGTNNNNSDRFQQRAFQTNKGAFSRSKLLQESHPQLRGALASLSLSQSHPIESVECVCNMKFSYS